MTLPVSARDLTDGQWQLVELARSTIDANTAADPDQGGVHTMGVAVRTLYGRMFPGVNLYHFTGGPCAELVALGAARAPWTVEGGLQRYDPTLFADQCPPDGLATDTRLVA